MVRNPRRAGRSARRALDRHADVMELQIEEDAACPPLQFARESKPPAIGEFHPDLIEGDRVAQPRDQRARRLDAFDVQRDDQPVRGFLAFRSPGAPAWPASR